MGHGARGKEHGAWGIELILPLASANGKKNLFNFQDFSPIFVGLKPLIK